MNILITSAGRRVSLVSYFIKEVKHLFGGHASVFTSDLNPSMSAACTISDGSFKVGYFSDPDYMEHLLTMCLKNKIKLIIPTLDPELRLLAQNREKFLKHGIILVISDDSFIKICRDKRLTNQFFKEKGFLVPKEVDKTKPSFPVFIKPIDGSSSKDLYFIDHKDKISPYLLKQDNLMWMEYLSNKEYDEYTIDLYYNKNSTLCCIVPRIRIATRGGETNKGITQKNKSIIDFVKKKLGQLDGARGCLTLQIFKHKISDVIYGIEINPRFGGGYPLSYLSGANYPKNIINEYLLDKSVKYSETWDDKKLLLRYDFELTIDEFEY